MASKQGNGKQNPPTIKQMNRDLKHESRQGRYMFHGRKQRNRDENVELGFLGTNMRVT